MIGFFGQHVFQTNHQALVTEFLAMDPSALVIIEARPSLVNRVVELFESSDEPVADLVQRADAGK